MPSDKISYTTSETSSLCNALANDLAIIKGYQLHICLIHARDIQLQNSDIDILVSDINALKKILASIGYFQIHYEQGPWVRLENKSKKWLVLDISYKYSFLKEKISTKEIIKRCMPSSIHKDLNILNEVDYAYYLAFKGALIKGYYSDRYINDISKGASVYAQMSPAEKHAYHKSLHLDQSSCLDLVKFSEQIGSKSNQSKAVKSIKKTVKYKKTPNNYSFIFKKLKRMRDLFESKNLIAIVGPDGSGKSTIVNKLSELPLSHIQYMGPGQNQVDVQPSIKPMKAWLDRGRYKHSKYSVKGKIFRIGYLLTIYVDILCRYLKARWEASKGKIVFFDRYAFDVYIRNPDAVRRFLFCKFFPRPNLIILLEGDAKAINNRKNELTISEIIDTYSRYKALFRGMGIRFNSVSSTGCDFSETMSYMFQAISGYRSRD